MGKNWYLGYSKTGREFEVAESLAWDNYETWCGRVKVRMRKGYQTGRSVEELPALPNYIFLCLSDDEYHEIRHQNMKHLYSKFVQLTAKGVREFKEFKDRIEHMEIIDRLKPGTGIEIIDGPFKHSMATLSRMVDGDRLVAEVEMLGQKSEVEFPIEQVRVAD